MWQVEELSLTTAFLGGLISFLSPCVLPLLPVYLSLITGLSTTEISRGGSKLRILIYTLIFISGFSTIYISMGIGSSVLATIFLDHGDIWRTIGGAFLIVFGGVLIGVIRSGILMREFRLNIKLQKIGSPFGAFLVGVGFAAGWSPCIGPILGSILIYSSMTGSTWQSLKMLSAYSLGLAVPFLISSLVIESVMRYLRKYIGLFRWINYVLGFILIVIGITMVLGIDLPMK